jgi:dihydrofolate reductase
VRLAFISAIAGNRVIGNKGKLPWHIPEDLKRFKKLTTGHPVLMGRKTFDSLGEPLPRRRNIVLSSRPIGSIECYRSIPDALTALADEQTVFVLGGGEIFAQLLERAHLMYLTEIVKEYAGDAFFPPYKHLVGVRFRIFNEEIRDGFAFRDYERIGS